MGRLLHIIGAYASFDFKLTDDDMCIVQVRGKEPKLISIEQAHINFNNIPWVKGCGGIIHSYIFDTETRETKYL